jgi:PAS domain S-box-containing protein
MHHGIFRHVRAYLVAAALLGAALALVSAIFFTLDNLPWTAFLTGILVASVLAEAARASRSEWVLLRRTTQLSAIKEKLEQESVLRRSMEEKYAESQLRLRLMDEKISTMIALIDTEGRCRYHNRAFREWLRLKAESIDGRPIRDLFGSRAYAGIATAVRQSLDGQSLHYEFLQEMPGGALYRLLVDHIPLFETDGKIAGFYFLAEDITERRDVSGVTGTQKSSVAELDVDQQMYLDVFSEQVSGRQDAGKQFISAIQGGEFRLYCQLIAPLPVDSGRSAHYEILIRLLEEEGGMIPPGAFFPLAEKNGLMPYLDRWVVEHVLDWVSHQQSVDKEALFFINVGAATLGDPDFPEFLQGVLNETGMPGSVLCFEVAQIVCSERVAEFTRQVKLCGCRIALSGFGRDSVSFDQIRGFEVDFIKIDGSLIFNLLSNPVNLAKVISIDRVAKKIGVRTVAELVENDEIIEKLSEIGIDFAQGFGVSRPRILGE